MSTPGTALKDVIAALVAIFGTALDVPVHNRRQIGSQPDRAYVVVGADSFDGEADGGMSSAAYAGGTGLGQRARSETLYVPCLAVYRATSEAEAHDGAIDLHNLAAAALVADPKLGLSYIYNALSARVDRTRIIPLKNGRLCAATFTVTAQARLV